MDTSCGWFSPTANSISGGWIRVAAYYILWLAKVPAVGYKLRLIPSRGWLEFQRLGMSCCWTNPTAVSSSCDWIRVVGVSILRLTWVQADYSWFHPVAGYGLWFFYPAAESRSTGWIWLAADLYFNISSKFKDLFCNIHHFYSLFSTSWFQLPLIQALDAASRILKKLEEVWGSLKKLQDSSCHWFKLQQLFELRRLIRDLWPIDYLQNFDPDLPW